MVIIMKIWSRLDEVIGAGLLTTIAVYSLKLGIGDIANACVAGIIALLAVKAVVKKEGGEN